MEQEKELLVEDGAEFLVALQEFPIPKALFTLATEPVVLANASPSDKEHASSDGWDVTQKNVAEDVIPPAFSEVRQDVLNRKLDNLVQQLPKVKDVSVSDDKRGEEPVAQVHNIVVIEVVHNVIPFELAIVVVSMHFGGYRLVQTSVEVAKEVASLLWTEIQHEDKPAHVAHGARNDQAIDTLHGGTQTILGIRFQVAECEHEHDNRVDASPNVSLFDLISCLEI